MKIKFIDIVFLIVAIFSFFFINNSIAETSDSSIMYYFPGWDYPGCGTVSESYGHTVEEVARKEIEKQNKITNCTNCGSPAVLVSADEETGIYVEKGICPGDQRLYAYHVQRITLPFKQASNLGSGVCEN